MKAYRWILVVVLSVALVGSTIVWYAASGGRSNFVATVNGTTITETEFAEQLEAMYGSQALRTLIMKEMVMAEARSRGLAPTTADIDAEIQDMKDEFGESGFQQFLGQYQMNEASFRMNLHISMGIDNIRFSEVEVTEQDLRTFFEENESQFQTQERIRASHALLPTEDEALEALSDIASGGDFDYYAREKSLDTQSAQQDGDLGFFGRGEMVAEFEEAAFGASIGDIVGPVATSFGYHIIKIVDRQEATSVTFEEVREEVERSFRTAKARPGQEVLAEIRQNANVEYARIELANLGY